MTGGVNETKEVWRIRTRLGVTPAQSRILFRLYQAEGDAVKADDLLDVCTGHWDVGPEVLKVQVSKIRRRLGADAIPNVWNVGYRLSETALGLVREALA